MTNCFNADFKFTELGRVYEEIWQLGSGISEDRFKHLSPLGLKLSLPECLI